MFTPPYSPMDLEQHISHAFRHHYSTKTGLPWIDAPNGTFELLIDGIADGVANWMMQREAHMAEFLSERLADMPSELLERVSVALAEAAIVSQKAGR